MCLVRGEIGEEKENGGSSPHSLSLTFSYLARLPFYTVSFALNCSFIFLKIIHSITIYEEMLDIF